MDESAINGIQSLELNGSDAAIPESRRFRCARICVEGYDTLLPRDDVDTALRKHFASCGEIAHVSIRRNAGSDLSKSTYLNRYAMIYIVGEDAEEKALALSGSDVGGWTVLVDSASPYPKDMSDDELAVIRAEDRYEGMCGARIVVRGYDDLLDADELMSTLRKHFASCGEVAHITLETDEFTATLCRYCYMYIVGDGAEDKAVALSGTDVGGWTVVTWSDPIPKVLTADELAAQRAKERYEASR
ncbi:hypothetical protein EUTSA_v10014517mg [Eutrema salsugineum]|uniref:RRM domain-containing protein n=2 Tax=Eutrema salsugineum TaxID=72664 RepID=V4KRK7_EUTSA|nr:hypothetical protein EUTSA_v10014517mg [Eutrema salsugineum]